MRLQEHMRAIRARTTSPLQSLKARLARPLRPLLDSAFVQRMRALGRRLAAAGTAPYPPDVRRRLKILNVICYLIATTNFALRDPAGDDRLRHLCADGVHELGTGGGSAPGALRASHQ